MSRHHLALELGLEPALVEQVEDAAEAQRLVEERDAAPLELVQHVVDVDEAEAELAAMSSR